MDLYLYGEFLYEALLPAFDKGVNPFILETYNFEVKKDVSVLIWCRRLTLMIEPSKRFEILK